MAALYENRYSGPNYDEAATGGHRRQAGRHALNRLKELRPLVDRIINEHNLQSKEVKSGLQAIKNYQTNVLDELRELVEEEDERGSYYYPKDSYAQGHESHGYGGHREDTYAVAQEREALREQLEDEYRNGNRLAQDYRNLQNDYNQLKNEVHKLKKKNRFDDVEQSDSASQRPLRATQEIPKPKSRAKYQQEPTRYKTYQPNRKETIDLQEENDRLREDLAHAEETIERLTAANQELERKLRRAEDTVARLEQSKRSPERVDQLKAEIDRLHAELRRAQSDGRGGPVLAEINELKRQNEELRVETIKLLKKKQNGGNYGEANELRDEVSKLHAEIQRQNEAKRLFVADMDSFKRRFAALQAENRQLKARLGQDGRVFSSAQTFGYGGHTITEYQSKVAPAYSSDYLPEGDRYGGDNKLDKYKQFLNEVRTNKLY